MSPTRSVLKLFLVALFIIAQRLINAKPPTTTKKHHNHRFNFNEAKNVIFFLGDGMGMSTVTAARIYREQLGGLSHLAFERFPFVGLSKTACHDAQTADSACSATSYLCGVKANYGTIGVNGEVPRGDCEESALRWNHVSSVAEWAMEEGKAAGLVTTTRVTHASPAAVYAHTAEREWESDSDVLKDGESPQTCPDIASQLVFQEPGSQLRVILGGGRKKFTSGRADGIDLTEVWQETKPVGSRYVTTKDELAAVDFDQTPFLLGLFHESHLSYNLTGAEDEPSLAEMTEAAIRMLQKEQSGFFLFVEGGRIDHAHHSNLARYGLDETVKFSEAIEAAQRLVDLEDTLIVVTADHSHTMTISGYSSIENNILVKSEDTDALDDAYMTLSYASGPGAGLKSITDEIYPALVSLRSAAHGGEDVPVYAIGPQAHLFAGVYEQNRIPHFIAHAAGLNKI